MKVRGRNEESTVSLNYLTELHNLHEDWLIKGLKHRPAPVSELAIFVPQSIYAYIYIRPMKLFFSFNLIQVLVLDGNLDIEEISAEYIRSEGRILNPLEVNNP